MRSVKNRLESLAVQFGLGLGSGVRTDSRVCSTPPGFGSRRVDSSGMRQREPLWLPLRNWSRGGKGRERVPRVFSGHVVLQSPFVRLLDASRPVLCGAAALPGEECLDEKLRSRASERNLGSGSGGLGGIDELAQDRGKSVDLDLSRQGEVTRGRMTLEARSERFVCEQSPRGHARSPALCRPCSRSLASALPSSSSPDPRPAR